MRAETAVALTVLAALSFGCGKMESGHEKAERDAASRGAVEKSAELPADFPQDVPVLAGATVKVALSQGKRTLLHLYTSSSVSDAAKFYSQALKSEGWKIQDTTMARDMSTISATKGKNVCGVTIAKEGRGTLIRLAVSEQGS